MIRMVFVALTFVLVGSKAACGDERTGESTPFDVKALKEVVKQVKALQECSDNEFLLDEKTAALDKSVQQFQGVPIAWKLTVQQVRRQAVYLQNVVQSPTQIYFVKELPKEANDQPLSELGLALRQQTERSLFHSYSVFKIGSTVDIGLARRLRAGDKVTVLGAIARIGVHAGGLIVVVSKTKVTGGADSKVDVQASVESSSVGSALDWLAKHQSADGSWSFDHRGGQCDGRCPHPGTLTTGHNAATAMALLPLLGAGETHKKGIHKDVIRRGVSFLMENAKQGNETASFLESGGNMYSHGLCTIALCEVYRSSGDEALRQIAQLALNFVAQAQDPIGGGWRYMPRQPGDTSVTGWQVSAIHAGQMAGLDVSEATTKGATHFLNGMQSDGGARYGYTSPGAGVATTPIGLLSRLRLGWERDHEAIERGVQFLQNRGQSERDMYYNYYASQVMFHYGGEPWEKWQETMNAFLVAEQDREGHPAGSWYISGNHGAERGGRLYCTALAASTLEIYLRHLAIYRPSKENDQETKE